MKSKWIFGLIIMLIFSTLFINGHISAKFENNDLGNISIDNEVDTFIYLPLVINQSEIYTYSYLERALVGEFSGTVVTMTGPMTGEEEVNFLNSIEDFEIKTGIDIQYEYLEDFEVSITEIIESGNSPDIVDFPQPGLLAYFVKNGFVVDLSQYLNMLNLQTNYDQSWLDMAMMESPEGEIMAGIWYRASVKSLVWYPKEKFIEANYEIPTSWDELFDLSQQIVDKGTSAWCIGIESGEATGWPATDWIEDIMLRTTSLENYDKWVEGELKFTSPEVKNAFVIMSNLWFAEGFTYGGRESIATTWFGDVAPMFEEEPQCWLHRQASFITPFFPDEAVAGVDYDFFYLPAIDPNYENPILVSGDIVAAFNDRDEVLAVVEYFSNAESIEEWIKAGGVISPHQDSNLDWYSNEIDRKIAELLLSADSVRFDGSDLMPKEVGTGSFWEEITAYVSNLIDLDITLANIDASWPE